MNEKVGGSNPFQDRTGSLPNTCSVEFVFCAKQSPSVRLRLSEYGWGLRIPAPSAAHRKS